MVLIKHEVPSGMEYRYKDHTISEQPDLFSKAENASAKTQGQDGGEPSKGTSPISFIDYMSAEGRRNYVRRLVVDAEQKLAHFNSQPEPDSESSYRFQLEFLEYQNKIKLLRNRVRELERKEATIPPPQNQSATTKEKDMSDFSTNAPFCNTAAPVSQSGNHALQDYQMQLMLLEQQNKKSLRMTQRASADVDMSPNAPFLPTHQPLLPPPESYASQEPHSNPYGAPLYEFGGSPNYYSCMIQVPPPPPPPPVAAYGAPVLGPNGSLFGHPSASPHRADSPHQSIEKDWKPSHSWESRLLPDYNMQLMLLEQQNKKRLMMARQEAEAMFFSPKAAAEEPEAREYYISNPSSIPPPPKMEFNEGRPLAFRTAPQPSSTPF